MNINAAVAQAAALLQQVLKQLEQDPNAGNQSITAPAGGITQPPIAAIKLAQDLTGTNGNWRSGAVDGIAPGVCVSWRYDFSKIKSFGFESGGQAQNGTPPYVWCWVSKEPGGEALFAAPFYLMGQGTPSIYLSAAQLDQLRSQGEVAIYYNEQCDGAGQQPGPWNRAALIVAPQS